MSSGSNELNWEGFWCVFLAQERNCDALTTCCEPELLKTCGVLGAEVSAIGCVVYPEACANLLQNGECDPAYCGSFDQYLVIKDLITDYSRSLLIGQFGYRI